MKFSKSLKDLSGICLTSLVLASSSIAEPTYHQTNGKTNATFGALGFISSATGFVQRVAFYNLNVVPGTGIASVGPYDSYVQKNSTNSLSVGLAPGYKNPVWKVNGSLIGQGLEKEIIVSEVTDIEVSASKILPEGSVFRFK